MSGKAPCWKKMRSTNPIKSRMYLGMFSFVSFKVLNFKDIMLMLETNKMARARVRNQTTQKLLRIAIFSAAAGMKPRKSALAGVGSPMKFVDCRSSMLKFAKRTAERAGTNKTMKGIISIKGV